jgi:membrane protease YdiL (CAAX protease family)
MNPDEKNPLVPEGSGRAEPSPESERLALPSNGGTNEALPLFEIAAAPFESASPVGVVADSASHFSNIPEDLRVPWGWLDLLFLVLLAVGGIVVLSVLVAIGLAAVGGNPRQLQQSATANFLIVLIQAVLDLGLLGFLAAQMRMRFHSPFWWRIGWRRLDTGTIPRWVAYGGLVLAGCLIAVLVTFASTLAPPKGELPIQQILQDRHTLILFALMAVFIAPVVEETLFRGYLYPVVARSFGMSAGVISTGIVFGLLHASQLSGGWWQIALLVVVGIIFTLVRAKTRTVVASYILHLSYNSIQVIALLVDTHGFQRMPSLH